MRLLLLFTLLFSSLTGFSQLVMDETAEFSGSYRDALVGKDFEVTNSGSESELFYWDVVRPDGMPAEWEFSICDKISCWPVGHESSECDNPALINEMMSGEVYSYFKVGLAPNGVAGVHTVEFRLKKVCQDATADDILASQIITFSISGESSNEGLINSDGILIYPNPTADRFQINEDNNIAQIAIYNIVGKQIATDNHYEGKAHDISDLDKGIYLVRMIDVTQDVVKVLRLTKE